MKKKPRLSYGEHTFVIQSPADLDAQPLDVRWQMKADTETVIDIYRTGIAPSPQRDALLDAYERGLETVKASIRRSQRAYR